MYAKYVELRNARGLTDYKVSKDTGISRSTLFEWKQKNKIPKVDKLQVLAQYFDVSVNVFFEG